MGFNTASGATVLGGVTTLVALQGAITFNSTVDADVPGRIFNATSLNGLTFQEDLGKTMPFGTLNLTTGSGNIALNALSGNTILGGTTTFNSGSGSIFIGTAGTNAASINSNQIQQSLTIQTSGAGAITFAGPVGTTSPFSELFLSTGTGAIAFDGATLLGGPAILGTQGGAVSFASTLDASTITTSAGTNQLMNLTIDVPSGTNGITFTGAVGKTGPLNVVTLSTDGSGITFSDFFCFPHRQPQAL